MKKLKRIYSNETFVVVINVRSFTAATILREAFMNAKFDFTQTGFKFEVTVDLEVGGQLHKLLKSLDI